MEGIVLKRINFEETSYILNILTKEGYLSVIVKGAKKKNSLKLAISEPITLIDFNKTRSSSMPTLTEGTLLEDYKNLKNDLVLLSIASVITEYAYQIKDQDLYFDRIFDLVINALNEIESTKELALFRFESLLLRELGAQFNEEHLIENYEYYDELKPSLVSLFNDTEIENKEILRTFFIDYFSKELGIKIKSKKMYVELI